MDLQEALITKVVLGDLRQIWKLKNSYSSPFCPLISFHVIICLYVLKVVSVRLIV